MQGENIDFYLAMSLDGISVLNDLAGGVTVTLEDAGVTGLLIRGRSTLALEDVYKRQLSGWSGGFSAAHCDRQQRQDGPSAQDRPRHLSLIHI